MKNADNKFKILRKHSGMTQEKFCEKYKIPLSTLKQWELDKAQPPEYVYNLLKYKVYKDIGL